MSNKKQSSVEYAVEKLEKLIPHGNQIIISLILEQVKAMHKNEIIEAWENGNHKEMRGGKYLKPLSSQYYKETFNSDEA